jgi:hypothetical protein
MNFTLNEYTLRRIGDTGEYMLFHQAGSYNLMNPSNPDLFKKKKIKKKAKIRVQ